MNLEAVKDLQTAIIHKAGDENDLADKMKWLMANYDKAIGMGERARLNAWRHYDISLIATAYEQVLKSYATTQV